MAEQVTGDTYRGIDGQLHEIKRQLRQREGYPHSLEKFKRALQEIIDGHFVDFGAQRLFALKTIVAHSGKDGIARLGIKKFGGLLVTDGIIPIQLQNGGYIIAQWHMDADGVVLSPLDLGEHGNKHLKKSPGMPTVYLGESEDDRYIVIEVDVPYGRGFMKEDQSSICIYELSTGRRAVIYPREVPESTKK